MKRIPIAEPSLGPEELETVVDAVKSGWVSSQGRYVPQFEQGFADFCGSRFGVATSSGTTALHLALEAVGVGRGDEVLVPTLTFVATANAVHYTEAVPVFVDSHKDYWGMDPAQLGSRITPRTKAVIPVHLYGHPCDMEPIMEIAARHGLMVIEDAAEAHGAESRGRRVGSFGTVSCFSFYGNKIMTTGEGGICLTDDEALYRRMRILRDHGMSPGRKYWHETVGFNYRMTNVQAAIGVAQLGKLESFIARKRWIADMYTQRLRRGDVRDLVTVHPEMPWGKCVYWLYSVLVEGGSREERDALIEALATDGIETRPFFYPIHTLPPYMSASRFPVAERLSETGLNLPSSFSLEDRDIDFVVERLVSHLRSIKTEVGRQRRGARNQV